MERHRQTVRAMRHTSRAGHPMLRALPTAEINTGSCKALPSQKQRGKVLDVSSSQLPSELLGGPDSLEEGDKAPQRHVRETGEAATTV